jgi:hypothetical protein
MRIFFSFLKWKGSLFIIILGQLGNVIPILLDRRNREGENFGNSKETATTNSPWEIAIWRRNISNSKMSLHTIKVKFKWEHQVLLVGLLRRTSWGKCERNLDYMILGISKPLWKMFLSKKGYDKTFILVFALLL